MKILILHTPRVGATSLMESLAKEHNAVAVKNPIGEVFTDENIPWEEENLVVKQDMLYPLGNKYDVESDKVNFYTELAGKFDIVRLIVRNDLISQAESFGYMLSNPEEEGKKYNYRQISEEHLLNCLVHVQQLEVGLRKVRAKINGEIECYEDLFDEFSAARHRQIKEEGRLI